MAGLHLINERFLHPNRYLGLDPDWDGFNGLRGLQSRVVERTDRPLVVAGGEDVCFTPERHLPTPGQRGDGPQPHTAAGTAAPTTGGDGGKRVRRIPQGGIPECGIPEGGERGGWQGHLQVHIVLELA